MASLLMYCITGLAHTEDSRSSTIKKFPDFYARPLLGEIAGGQVWRKLKADPNTHFHRDLISVQPCLILALNHDLLIYRY